MIRISILVLLLLSISSLTQAQTSTMTELAGVRHAGQGLVANSNATFAIGMSLNGGLTFVNTARTTDPVIIYGTIRPEPAHIGQKADFFLVDIVNDGGNLATWTQRTTAGRWQSWNGEISSLAPFLAGRTLTAATEITSEILYAGFLGAGEHRLYLGYRPADGILRYTPNAKIIIIAAQSPASTATGSSTSTSTRYCTCNSYRGGVLISSRRITPGQSCGGQTC